MRGIYGSLLASFAFCVVACALCCSAARAALPVVDAALMRESVNMRVQSMQRWAKNNQNQIEQIRRQDTGNEIARATEKVLEDNMRMHSQDEWDLVRRSGENSLALLYAVKAVWDEYGSAERYYAAFMKSGAWEQCMRGRSCSFSKAVERLNDSAVSQAIRAYDAADGMTRKLQTQIDSLQRLVSTGQGSASLAETLDNLSKINGMAVSSLIELNAQCAQLTRLLSHETANRASADSAAREHLKAVTRSRALPSSSLDLNLRLPE